MFSALAGLLRRVWSSVRDRTLSLDRRRVRRLVFRGLLLAAVIAVVYSLYWTGRRAWAIHRLERGVGDTVFLDAAGKPWFRLDENRQEVPLARIAPHLQQAVIAVEDHRFRLHPGIDPIAFGRAVLRNLRAGEVREGGSTISQQLARTLFLSNRRTAGRKLKEALLALLLELQLSKDQILELYLNRVYMGSGLYGVEAMSQAVFAKPAARLSLAESALLAGLIRAPGALSPWTNLDGAVERSRVVLRRMREERYVTEAEEVEARAVRLRPGPPPKVAAARGGYAKRWLREQFLDHFDGDHPPDWEVATTFDRSLQDAAERSVQGGLRALRIEGLQAALVAMDPQTGDVLALVGGRDALEFPFDRATKARRQPGSAFKPIVYAAALARGLSPVSELVGLDRVRAGGATEWAPTGHDEAPDRMTLRQALRESDNRAAVLLQRRVGRGAVRGLAAKLGVPDMPDVESLALGTGVLTPLQLTTAYAAFANGGLALQPRGIVAVLDADGDLAWEQPVARRRVLHEAVAFQTLSLLRDVVERGTGRRARSLGVWFSVAGKTGTTDDYRDAWFVGFSSSVVAAVWVGFDQPATIRQEGYGARIALPIWADFMKRAARVRPTREFAIPFDVRPVELCSETFLRPVEACPTYVEYFKDGDAVPKKLCPAHHGDLKQELRRQLLEWLGALGRKIGRRIQDE
jgi:1A family penicillin-binding protein